jgi:predicted dehydrogenase
MKPFRLGFIGGALDSAVGYAHFAACRMDRRWSLEAGFFSPQKVLNQQTAEAYGVARAHLHYDFHTFLDKEKKNLDAVSILSPTPLHKSMVADCLRVGIPVICEKALAVSSRDILELESCRSKTRGFLAVIYNYSGYPMVREMRRLIRTGKLGRILHFQAEMPQEGYMRTDSQGRKPKIQSWRLRDGAVPTIHLDLGVHLHQLIRYLTELKPREVIADHGKFGWFRVVDQVVSMTRYDQGAQGAVWFSKTALGHRNGLRLRIYGSKASAEWAQINPEELLISHGDGRREILDRGVGLPLASKTRYNRFKAGHPSGFVEALSNLYADIHTTLKLYHKTGRQQSEEVFGATMALEGLNWLEAMVRSTRSKKWEKVSGVR